MQRSHKSLAAENKLHTRMKLDADEMCLAAEFSDELSAHRVKRSWIMILREHFLLDQKRDFTLIIKHSPTAGDWVLHCSFDSTCGRYAFWRLINRQAPEAYKKLLAANAVRLQLPGGSPRGFYLRESLDTFAEDSSWFSLGRLFRKISGTYPA